MMIKGWLPYPPTVNKYWVRMAGRVCRSPRAQDYSKEAILVIKSQKIVPFKAEKYCLTVYVNPPDNRRRDVDNAAKAICDVIQASGLIEDDYDIWRIEMERCEPIKGGRIMFILKEYINNA